VVGWKFPANFPSRARGAGQAPIAKLSVVVPVYQSEDCLRELYARVKKAAETISPDFELVLVEDRSRDRSWDVIRELAKADPRVKGLQFSRNFGQHFGITAGLDHCGGDWVVVMDCDLQDPPEEIPRLYAKAQEGHDIVIARRLGRTDGPLKSLGSWLFYKLFNWLADLDYDWRVGNFRIMSRKVVRDLVSMREQLRFFGGLVEWMGYPAAFIDVQHGRRFAGETSYTFGKLWRLAAGTIVAYSNKPLRLAIRLGFLISLASLLAAAYVIYRKAVLGVTIEGWTSLIVSVYLLGGIIISILGILGIYLGEIFNETKKRPLYIVREATFDRG